MAEATKLWCLGDEEKSRHITVFYGLNPENGVLLGERCRELFVQSNLSPEDLSHIWRISDVDGDGALNVGEFTVAMHLINAKLSGRELPKGLPPSIRPCVDKTIPGVTTKDYETYVKAFNELDKNQTGSLTAEEAKPVFIKSQLLTGHLAHVWNLADYDHDGNLSVNEFVLATHLMRFLKSGNQLPSIMDVKALLPEQIRQKIITPPSTPTKEDSSTQCVDVTAHNQTDSGHSKASIHRGKWMTFSSKKPCGMFTKGENRKPVDSNAAFSPTSGFSPNLSFLSPSDENPFETDIFVPVDHQPRRVSVTSLESSTSIEPFEEDPFKSCDPFSNSFPSITEDPFETSTPDIFITGTTDPFADSSGSLDPFSTSKSDPFTESSDLFASNPVVVVQSSHSPFAGGSQNGVGKGELVEDKFESAFGDDDGFLSQETMPSPEKDPFVPAGSGLKLVEASGNENPFEGDSFVQFQSGLKENSDPFSVGAGLSVPASGAQLSDKHFGNQNIDPFGVAVSESGHSEKQPADNPFGNDTFQPTIPANTTDAFPLVENPFAASAATPAAEDSSNPFELDKFVTEQDKVTEQIINTSVKNDNAQLTEEASCKQAVSAGKAQEVDPAIKNERTSSHHVKFPEDSTIVTTFETYSSDEYTRKNPEVDPQRAELEVIRDEHRCIKHGLDDVEQHLLRRLSYEIEEEREDTNQQHVKFNEDIGTIPTFSSDEYDRKDPTVDPEKATEEFCKETGKKKLIPQDSVLNLRAKQAQQERRQKQAALQQQLIAEIDLEWEEKERTIEQEVQEAKEEAKRKFLADTEAAQKLEHERWQQKLQEKEEEQKKAEQDELERQKRQLEEAKRKAVEEESATEEKRRQTERQIEEERQRQEQEEKRRQEQADVEVQAEEERRKEETKRQASEDEDKAIAEREKTQIVYEGEAEAEPKEAPKRLKGLAARWEAVAGGQMKERSPPQNHIEVVDRIKREEEELLRRQQEHEEERLKRAEDAARKEQLKKEAIQKQKQKQLEEEEQEQRERQRREKEEEEKQIKKSSSQPKSKKHALAKQWEEKFSK